MSRKAQASLEYLMTYGWALVLIATVIGALVFIVSGPSTLVFSSSDPTKIMLKAGAIAGADTEVQLQNITGGKITITSITSNQFTSCTIDQQTVPVDIGAGSQMTLKCGAPGDNKGSIRLDYTDYAGLDRTAIIIVSGGGVTTEPGLVGFLTLNEGQGTTTADSSGVGNTGTLVGPPAWASDCISGNCLQFDGDGDYVYCENDSSLNMGNNNLSVSYWFKTTNPSYMATVAKSNGGLPTLTYGWLVGTNSTGGGVEFYASTYSCGWGDHGTFHMYAGSGYNDGGWHHAVVSVDRSANANCKIFIDGEPITPTYAGNITTLGNVTNSLNLRISGESDGGAYFKGAIDEVKIYNRALSATEALAEYNKNK